MALAPFHTKGLVEAGCDEAGRGCLAGPVVAAAVILPSRVRLPGLDDSKKLSERQREPAAEDWDMSELHVAEIAPDTFVLTYTLRQPGRVTRRATVWRRRAGRWQAVFHQGTVVGEAP